jgi:excisionase family DNA binding protein
LLTQPLASTEEVARYTGLSIVQVRRLVRSGALIAVRPAGPRGPMLFDVQDVDIFITTHKTGDPR